MAIVLIRNDNKKKSEKQQQKNILVDKKVVLSGDRTQSTCHSYQIIKENASSGNRTRAARVAGEHSTTEPTMPTRT